MQTDAEFLVIQRTQKKIRGARLQRVVAKLQILVDGYNDNGNFAAIIQFPYCRNKGGTVHMGHLVVGQDEIGGIFPDSFNGLNRIGKGLHLCVWVKNQRQLFHDPQICGLIVDNHNMRGVGERKTLLVNRLF